ncbi:guanylate kinase [Penicillium riverlandense]|uniref:guanylate kinase n=1 Tax=Penicillium riverlandense TaxID=1903569 RepID=UPI002549BA0E|nr:guanylate kinase [Penicillium riverlandense]KAJ5833241.1 guanylate kinase [Penicillium riverlandense]
MTLAPPPDRRCIVISGPSGVGKGTLIQKLFDAHPDTFALSVSHTTRQPRPGEREGINYFYISTAEFSTLVSQGAFVEYTCFSGNYYGTSKQTIADQMAKGLVVVLDIEMDGVKQIQENRAIDARYVFVQPPGLEALEARLRSRGTENEEQVQRRLAQAKAEMQFAQQGVHDKIIVNDDLEKAYQELEEFVYRPAS